MNNIKYFKYVNTKQFNVFLNEYGYSFKDIKGFKFVSETRYSGNILKAYFIYFNDGEYEYFKVAYFKDFNEYQQCRSGFKGDKLLNIYENANIRKYKHVIY